MLVQYIAGDSSVKIAHSIELAVSGGKIASGAQLPPVRNLASHLRVSPATVAAAYKSLQDRGVLVADGRRGTHVRHAAPLSVPAEVPLPAGTRNLLEGNPDPTLLPDLAERVTFRQRLYGEELNDAKLIALAREQFAADRVPSKHVAVLSGALDGIERVLREHLRAGERVAVEDPCFTGVLDLLNALSLVAVPVAVDDEGLFPDELRRAMKSCAAVIVTPRAQNPTGAAHTPKRARELRAVLAMRPDVLVIEDDHAGPVAGTPYLTLVDTSRERWAVVRSVSKSLGPDLRVALLAADEHTHARLEGRQTLGIRWVSHILQRLVVALWRDRGVQRLLTRAAKTYTERRDTLIRELDARGIEAHGRSGLNVWIPVAEESATVSALLHEGWGVQPGERYRIATQPAIRVTIATLDISEAAHFADDLARLMTPGRRAMV
ncbi:MAG TPA: aminotransferase class I/II-fold pyridoxal phosphate-dependent enzyme [Thermoanaerobaculia bacterium]|nr:aminotransferase class I/II-fold pyridoxal phosphate-dependent enzyme [Thermoanaerobaculia bacterium]